MTIFDRYLLFTFLKTFAISLISFIALAVVIHLFTNLDEVVAAAEKSGGMPQFIVKFYGPRALDIFDHTAAILILISAVFTFSMIQRRHELTAVQAAGVSKSRIARPILLAAIVLIGITILNRESWIPEVRAQLVREPGNWNDSGKVEMQFYKDPATGLLIRGNELLIDEKRIKEADIQIPGYLSPGTPRIRSQQATIVDATHRHPDGIMMHGVTIPEDLSQVASVVHDDRIVVFSPGDQSWLKPDQVFVAIDLDVEKIAYGKQLEQYSTLPEMMDSMRKPRMWYGHGQQVKLHSRILKPIIDLTLLLLGLPLVIARIDRNIFAATGLCLLVVLAVQGTTIGCSSLGAYSLIRPAALAAWLPVIVFTPLAVVAMRRMKT